MKRNIANNTLAYPSAKPLLGLNNFGRFEDTHNASDDLPIEITDIYNIIPVNNCFLQGPLFLVNCTTVNGKMCISVLYHSHIVSRSVALKYVENLQKVLLMKKSETK